MTNKLLTISLLLSTALITPTHAFAWEKADYKQLANSKECSGCDLSSINLRKWNLRGADLENSNLRNVNFGGADLSRANLEDADIRGANFRGAKLAGATWIDGKTCSSKSYSRCVDKY